jgi:hypothetical protein
MSKIDKLIKRLESEPKDFTYNELKKLLNNLGFVEDNKGKTSGSRIKFYKNGIAEIELHRPHPSNILKPYQVKDVIEKLKKGGLI